jgi:hypothetical protein
VGAFTNIENEPRRGANAVFRVRQNFAELFNNQVKPTRHVINPRTQFKKCNKMF